jgi:hypothetical protein
MFLYQRECVGWKEVHAPELAVNSRFWRDSGENPINVDCMHD